MISLCFIIVLLLIISVLILIRSRNLILILCYILDSDTLLSLRSSYVLYPLPRFLYWLPETPVETCIITSHKVLNVVCLSFVSTRLCICLQLHDLPSVSLDPRRRVRKKFFCWGPLPIPNSYTVSFVLCLGSHPLSYLIRTITNKWVNCS